MMERCLLAALAAIWLSACGAIPTTAPVGGEAPLLPESAGGAAVKPGWTMQKFAVAAANPLAADAGYRVLKAGGSAVDAAIATQMVLGLVEPQSSGIGGGAFLLHADDTGVRAYDGRETAPAATTPRLLLDGEGKPLKFHEAAVGGRAVGVPGTVAMLAMAHRKHGALPWKMLFEPAIRLAEAGFEVSPRLHALLAGETHLKKDAVAAALYYDAHGRPWPVGHRLRNPEYAAVLREIAATGAAALTQGEVARAIVAKVQGHPANPGGMTLADLAAYRPLEREPLCFDHRVAQSVRAYRVCGMPPPSSGTLAIGQILGLLEHTPAHALPPPAPGAAPAAPWLHLYTEAARLAYADRAQYVADPDFVAAPAGRWSALLDPAYLRQRAALIQPNGPSMNTATPGRPDDAPLAHAAMPEQAEYGTSHISVVDAAGRAVAMTTTIEDGWGARQMVNRGVGLAGGFLLNNELTDFSFAPTDAQGQPIANRVEAGKRPRSSMSPILVFDKESGQLVMSAGSPGGALIIHFVAKALIGTLHWGLTPQQAIDLPNFGSTNGPTLLEKQRFAPAVVEALKARGHVVSEPEMTSGLQLIRRTTAGLDGGADPRREGVVMGE